MINRLRKICVFLGLCLLLGAMVLLISWQWNMRSSAQKNESYVHTLRSLMPQAQGAVIEERRDNTMAAFSLDGNDFVGILEIPMFDSALPVSAGWGKTSKFPCCFEGSIYDSSLKIGATSQKGQYDFFRQLSVGDAVYFTDMEGNRYPLAVSDIRYSKQADQAALQRNSSPLTLFIKNVYAFEYIIISCDIPR